MQSPENKASFFSPIVFIILDDTQRANRHMSVTKPSYNFDGILKCFRQSSGKTKNYFTLSDSPRWVFENRPESMVYPRMDSPGTYSSSQPHLLLKRVVSHWHKYRTVRTFSHNHWNWCGDSARSRFGICQCGEENVLGLQKKNHSGWGYRIFSAWDFWY